MGVPGAMGRVHPLCDVDALLCARCVRVYVVSAAGAWLGGEPSLLFNPWLHGTCWRKGFRRLLLGACWSSSLLAAASVQWLLCLPVCVNQAGAPRPGLGLLGPHVAWGCGHVRFTGVAGSGYLCTLVWQGFWHRRS